MSTKIGGRPPVSEPRTRSITGHFSQVEFDQVMQRLDAAGLSRSEAVRLLLLHETLPKKIYSGVDPQAARAWSALAPLQNNLNQIAHWFHQHKVQSISAENTRKIGKVIKSIGNEVAALRREILTMKGQS